MQLREKTPAETRVSAEKIAWMHDNYARMDGWEGGTCYACGKTHNVLAGGPGWHCYKCGAYHVQSFQGPYRRPHEKPDYGPIGKNIRLGCVMSKSWQRIMQFGNYRLDRSKLLTWSQLTNKQRRAVRKTYGPIPNQHLYKFQDVTLEWDGKYLGHYWEVWALASLEPLPQEH